ncbi:hypothetical protein LCGC14_0577090 [marine sediment metagenome]|uniref:Uncharacterized protein n=1 Tax=marine sediment metagenome TaxID=412755 RepID=A0A0F9S134_9ZZZZ|nr:hypothetical protein [bacterium]
MPHLRVRQMPRKQQKAVFARMNRGSNNLGSNLVLNTERSGHINNDQQSGHTNKQPRRQRTLFFPPRSKRLARIISIKNPAAFRKSIRTLRRNGLTLRERRALILAQNRATAQLGRRNLSAKERCEFTEISKIQIPTR